MPFKSGIEASIGFRILSVVSARAGQLGVRGGAHFGGQDRCRRVRVRSGQPALHARHLHVAHQDHLQPEVSRLQRYLRGVRAAGLLTFETSTLLVAEVQNPKKLQTGSDHSCAEIELARVLVRV